MLHQAVNKVLHALEMLHQAERSTIHKDLNKATSQIQKRTRDTIIVTDTISQIPSRRSD